MSKRFSDTEIWRKKWFCDLSPSLKTFWRYICDNCDNAGVWEMNLPLAEFQIGCKLKIEEILSKFSDHLAMISDDKVLVVDFIKFQYGELKENCIPHQNIFKLLDRHGIPYPYPIDRVAPTLKDKEEEKDKDKEKEKETSKEVKNRIPPTLEMVTEYCSSRGNSIDPQLFIDHYSANGWMVGKTKMKDWQASIRTWEKRPAPAQTKKRFGYHDVSMADLRAQAERVVLE